MSSESELFDNLRNIAESLGMQYGRNCETVIHDLDLDSDHSIVFIMNGELTGRQQGDGLGEMARERVEAIRRESGQDRLMLLFRNRDGRMFKCCGVFIREKGRPRYLLGVSNDITNMMALRDEIQGLLEEEAPVREEQAVTSVGELLDELIERSIAMIGRQPALMSREDKVRAIQFLNDSGAFLITRSGEKIARCFGISKFTLYSYIDVNKKKS